MDDSIPDTSPRTKYAVPALEKGLDILECLSNQPTALTQAQLARELDREPSELFRMLICLEARNYIRRVESGGFELTLKLYELSRTQSPYDQLVQVASPLMQDLVDRVQQSCHLCVLHRDQLLVLVQKDSPLPIRLSVQVGSFHSPVKTLSGRILLAHLDPEKRSSFLERHADYLRLSAVERIAFDEQLQTMRADGWASADGALFIGGLDLSVPVGRSESHTMAALTMSALNTTDGKIDLFEHLPQLRQCAGEIARRCGIN